MRTAHIWNQYYLFSQKIGILLLMLLAISHSASAQRVVNLPDYEDQQVRWGFQLGGHATTLNIKHSPSYFLGDADVITSAWQQGFSAHFILQSALEDELWAFRITPGVALYTRFIETIQIDSAGNFNSLESFSAESATVEFPLMLKYRSLRRRNFRMYMVGGLVPSLITGNKETSFIKNYNLEVTYGLGFDFYWQFFKFAPEIRFSHGLVNFLKPNPNFDDVERLTTHRVSLYLNFE